MPILQVCSALFKWEMLLLRDWEWTSWKHSLKKSRRWRGALQQAGISSQPRKQVSRGCCVTCTGCGAFRAKEDKRQCQVCSFRPTKRRLGEVARKRFKAAGGGRQEANDTEAVQRLCIRGEMARGSCKHFRTCGGWYTVPTVESDMLIASSDEEAAWI